MLQKHSSQGKDQMKNVQEIIHLVTKDFFLQMKSRLYKTCVQGVIQYMVVHRGTVHEDM